MQDKYHAPLTPGGPTCLAILCLLLNIDIYAIKAHVVVPLNPQNTLCSISSIMALPHRHDAAFPNALYQEVKAWIAEQEAFEVANRAPAPLTDVQRMFLEGFRPQPPAPDTGNMDYVSLLCRPCPLALLRSKTIFADGDHLGYRQANPAGKKITFAEGVHKIRTAEGNPLWTCTVELSETFTCEPAIDSFPAAGFGLDETGCSPPFGKKKDAKQCMLSLLA